MTSHPTSGAGDNWMDDVPVLIKVKDPLTRKYRNRQKWRSHPAVGRFANRDELIKFIVGRWFSSEDTIAKIAEEAEVPRHVAYNIIRRLF